MLIQVFIVLIPITLIFIVIIAFVFYRALHGGQFDHLDEASKNLLADDDRCIDIKPIKKHSDVGQSATQPQNET